MTVVGLCGGRRGACLPVDKPPRARAPPSCGMMCGVYDTYTRDIRHGRTRGLP